MLSEEEITYYEPPTPKPFTPQSFKPNPGLDTLLYISETLRFAQKNLGYAAAEEPGYDIEIIKQINAEAEPIAAFLAKVLQGRRTIDRDQLKKITDELKGQVAQLLAVADRLKGIVANTGKPEWVNVYLLSVIANMAEVDALVKKLP
ncbi:MAG: hypothetical protein A4E72_00617 [Syntrophus sp. PtaU1.Bin208]|nr:MAG: hypothetical protein A4E72_00617 [Syntrophus sp. PtaU1.Bin208]